MKEKLETIFSMDFTDLNEVMNSITNILTHTADTAKIKTVSKTMQEVRNPPWFDADCIKTKKEISTLGKQRKQMPNCVSTRTRLYELKKKLKKLVKRNKTQFK